MGLVDVQEDESTVPRETSVGDDAPKPGHQ